MIDSVLQEKNQRTHRRGPYISYSRINRYLLCPEQYRFYYIEMLRPKILSAGLVFGKIVHEALAMLLQNQEDPVKIFQNIWNDAKQVQLSYNQKESWEKLNASGQGLLEKFVKEEFPKLHAIQGVEKPFEMNITGLDLPFIGIIDLIAEVEGKTTLGDFKTSGSSYEPHEVILSDQLTSYQIAEPEVEQTALCVLVKTKEPRIEWHVSQRDPETLIEYLDKVHYVASEISEGRFYKRPGKWCGYCDYLLVCMGDKQKTKETLVKISSNL